MPYMHASHSMMKSGRETGMIRLVLQDSANSTNHMMSFFTSGGISEGPVSGALRRAARSLDMNLRAGAMT